MVFESFVVKLINKYLGDYVENLDTSQLKLGILGGDAVLLNLDLKESALNEKDLPVKIKAGNIKKLTLKIPWKNLYTEPVVATVDGLYALVVPDVAVKYNEEKEEKKKQESKKKKLQGIEDAIQQETEEDNKKEQKEDSFAEKMAAQIIKNLQIKVMNIHVRYEDKYSHPQRPFSIGVSLKELLFQTTDENWNPCVIKETVSQVFKLIKLDSLAVYWNPNTEQFDGNKKPTILSKLSKGVADDEKDPGFRYLIKPISSEARLRLNTKPELNKFSTPKINLTIVFDDISVVLSKLQFDDVLEMIESFDRMNLKSKYRKYRPDVPHKKHAEQWWHYAQKSILEDIRRRRQMWSWTNIKKHRGTMKKYRDAYVKKLDGTTVSKELIKTIDDCEKVLDICSIILVRHQSGKIAKRGPKKTMGTGMGFVRGWFGGRNKDDKTDDKDDIMHKLHEEFTPDERDKLYKAIGYEQDKADFTVPKDYIDVKLKTQFTKLSLTLRNEDSKDPDIIKIHVKHVSSDLEHRPADNAVQVETKMIEYTVNGTEHNGQSPTMATLLNTNRTSDPLLYVLFETNPRDGACGTRIRLSTRPLQFLYDAMTVNNLVKFFKPQEDVYLQELAQSAVAKFEKIKEQSVAGLRYAIDQKKRIEISVDLQPSFVIIPEKGYYTKEASVVILDLGYLKVDTMDERSDINKGKKNETVEEMMNRAFHKFNINLDKIQILFSSSGEEWQQCRKLFKSPIHILEPISININVQKCILDKDTKLAKIKVSGELPLISLNISVERLRDLIKLAGSIPLPDLALHPKGDIGHIKTATEMNIGDTSIVTTTKALMSDQVDSKKFQNYKKMEVKFEIKKVDVNISQMKIEKTVQVIRLIVVSLGIEVAMHTFDINAEAYLGGIYIQHRQFSAPPGYTLKGTPPDVDGTVIHIVNSPGEDGSTHLLELHYIKAKKNGPTFDTTYGKIEQKIDVTFTSLQVLLHQEALLHILELVEKFKPAFKPKTKVDTSKEEKGKDTKKKDKMKEEEKKKHKRNRKDTGVIDIQMNVELREIEIALCTKQKYIADVKIKGIYGGFSMESGLMIVTASLTAISISNPSDRSDELIYSEISIVEGVEDIIKTKLEIYDEATKGDKYAIMTNVDARVEVHIGCIKLIFVDKFVVDILNFLNKLLDMQKQLNKAKKIAAQYSKDVTKKYQDNLLRISFIVEMKAPVIIVPMNSKSANALVADFGSFSVQNSFKKAKGSKKNIPGVLDIMVVQLTSMKISRAVIGKNLHIKDESLILEPIHVELSITRNVSTSISNELPDFEITGKMKSVSAKLSQTDFTQIMETWNDILAEVLVPLSQMHERPQIEPKDKKEMGLHDAQQSYENVACKLKFDFKIESLSATLYVGDENLMAKRVDKAALSKIHLKVIAGTVRQMSDKSIEVECKLEDMVLDDCRYHEHDKGNRITRMIQKHDKRMSGKYEDKPSIIIDVSATQTRNKNSSVDVRINSLYICVCLDYLKSLKNFVTKGMAQRERREDLEQEKKQEQTSSKEEREKACMDIVVNITNPEIVLVEDQFNRDCNSLFLNCEVTLKMKIRQDFKDMSANVRDLQIFSCVFSKRGSVAAQILNPCEISFNSTKPYGEGANMQISASDLVFNISPATIKTMSKIGKELVKKSESMDQTSNADQMQLDLWSVKNLSETDFWFLKMDEDISKDPTTISEEMFREKVKSDQLKADIPSIVIIIEGGVGKRTVPLLIAESSLSGEANDWNSKLSIDGTLQIEVAYYNEKLSVWEPLLEPVFEDGKMKRFEIDIEVRTNCDVTSSTEEDEVLLPPKMTVDVASTGELQLTISKTSYEVLQNLSKAFGDAYMLVEPSGKAGLIASPFCILNNTGLDVVVTLDNSFEMPKEADGCNVTVKAGKTLELSNKKKGLNWEASVIKATQEIDDKKISFKIGKSKVTQEVTVKRAEKRLFKIDCGYSDIWSVIVKTETNIGQKILSIQSIVQIQNHFHVPIEVHYKNNKEIRSCGVVSPESIFCVPLAAVYTSGGEFLFKPFFKEIHTLNYEVCKESVSWRNAEKSGAAQMKCQHKSGTKCFYISVNAEIENIYYDVGDAMSAKLYIFHLSPTVVLHNLLPYPIKFHVEEPGQIELMKGENKALFNACVGKSYVNIVIPKYDGHQWTGKVMIRSDLPELSICTFQPPGSPREVALNLGLHCKKTKGCIEMSVYSHYCMINKTGQDLSYKASDGDKCVNHYLGSLDIVLLSFKEKTFSSKTKKKASLKIANSEWSDKFSLDTVGSSGNVQCKGIKKQIFTVGVKITLSSSGLTKICTFTPFYMLLNTTENKLWCRETGKERYEWIEVDSKKCVPFWPVQTGNDLTMMASVSKPVKKSSSFLFDEEYTTFMKLTHKKVCSRAEPFYRSVVTSNCKVFFSFMPFWPMQSGNDLTMMASVSDTIEETSSFLFDKEHTTLMKLTHNKHTGLNVNCKVTESATVITFNQYMDGMATALLINHTNKDTLRFRQSGNQTKHELAIQKCMLYTWDNAIGKREIIWTLGEKQDEINDLQQDGIGEFADKCGSKIYWVSFLNGMQRVLLFTDFATIAREIGKLERSEQEITFSIQGIGLSLTNDVKQKEVAYIEITSSGIIWEEEQKKRSITLDTETGETLEKGYQEYIAKQEAGECPASKVDLENKIEVDWSEMMMYKPKKKQIRRTFHDGLWVQFNRSANQQQLHAKIQRLQVDNQMSDATFQTVFTPTPLVKSIAAESIPKPFIELSLTIRKPKHSTILQFKYCKVLTQEMTLKIDLRFLNELIDIFYSPESVSSEQQATLLERDYQTVHKPLKKDKNPSLKRKNFYDYLHISPIKIHLSVSTQGCGGDGIQTAIDSDMINIFLQSAGVVLGNVQDVILKLGFFQREHQFFELREIRKEVKKHYKKQAIKQMYVLVLGLDVLGNPFGVIRGMADGIHDLFYEPAQGAILGPGEFAEGLTIGVKSLFGHTVGGVSGAFSKMTGVLGKGLAALTFDDDYQKKRREDIINKRSANAKERLARGGKGVVMGVFHGVTGVVKKPVEGAKTDGVGGFFKGLGKGLVGVVAKPTGGVVDFASSSFEGIKRIAHRSDEVSRLRNPRMFRFDKILRPYNRLEADGHKILQETEEGKFASSDYYVDHAVISSDNRDVLLVTDKRLIYTKRGMILGHWEAEWFYTWGEIKETPKRIPKGIAIELKIKEKKFPFGKGSGKKDIIFEVPEAADYIIGKIVKFLNRQK